MNRHNSCWLLPSAPRKQIKLPGHIRYSCISDIQWIERKCWTLCFSIFRSVVKFSVLHSHRMPLDHLSTMQTSSFVTKTLSKRTLLLLWAHKACLFASQLLEKGIPFPSACLGYRCSQVAVTASHCTGLFITSVGAKMRMGIKAFITSLLIPHYSMPVFVLMSPSLEVIHATFLT